VRWFGLSRNGNDDPQVGHSPPARSLTLHERLPATLESVGAARRAIRGFAAGLEVDLDGIALAVSEAVSNVVAHAYDDDVSDGDVELSAGASPFELIVTVRDRGRGLAAGNVRPGAGFGLTIIRRVAEQVEVSDTPRGVALTMAFRRGAAGWSGR
jgi:anti-sigma regulatory factor (Ser/Thr protein kinase)